jgi:hypothetical protein
VSGLTCRSLASDFTVARHLAGAMRTVCVSLVSLIVKNLSLMPQTQVSYPYPYFSFRLPQIFLRIGYSYSAGYSATKHKKPDGGNDGKDVGTSQGHGDEESQQLCACSGW